MTANPCLDLQTSHRGRAAIALGPSARAGTSARLPLAHGALGGGLCRAVVCAWGPGKDTLSHRRSPVPQPVLLALLGAVLGTAVASRAAGPRASCGDPYQLHLSI